MPKNDSDPDRDIRNIIKKRRQNENFANPEKQPQLIYSKQLNKCQKVDQELRSKDLTPKIERKKRSKKIKIFSQQKLKSPESSPNLRWIKRDHQNMLHLPIIKTQHENSPNKRAISQFDLTKKKLTLPLLNLGSGLTPLKSKDFQDPKKNLLQMMQDFESQLLDIESKSQFVLRENNKDKSLKGKKKKL